MQRRVTDIARMKTEAVAALREGRIADGIVAFRAVLAIEPGSALGWYNLGYLLRSARRFEEALDAYAQALALGIDGAEEVHLNRAVILSEFRGRDDEAEAELRAALVIAPAFVPAWLNLGNLYEDRGDPVRAREAYARALVIEPGNGRAVARSAVIDIAQGRGQAVPSRLQAALGDPRLSGEAAAEIGFALGNALDAEGRYDAAFAAFARANAAAAGVARVRYDPRAHEALIDALIAMPPLPAVEATGAAPVFVLGMFRSGSTLVEQILSRHSRMTAGGEIDAVPALVEGLRPYPQALADAPIADLRDHYLAEVRARYPDAGLLTDKRPDNFLHVALIKAMFPDAKIVHTVRDPIDTLLSVWFLYFDDSIAYGHAIEDIAHWIGQYRRLMAHWRALYLGDIHDIAYEDVVAEPRATIAALLGFLGLDWENAVLSPQDACGSVRTASAWQVRAPLHQRSAGRWQNYAKHLDGVRALIG